MMGQAPYLSTRLRLLNGTPIVYHRPIQIAIDCQIFKPLGKTAVGDKPRRYPFIPYLLFTT